MEVISLIIGLIGIGPILFVSYDFLYSRIPTRKFFSFTNTPSLDVVITTSSFTHSTKGAKVQRATTGIGQVLGVAHLSKFIGKFYKKKEINVHMGNNLSIRPPEDIVLLGGPSKNEYSNRFIQGICKKNPELNLIVDDVNSKISIKNYSYDDLDLEIQKGIPTKDIGIVICCGNPFSSSNDNGRALYCAGLTSYGTCGSALWLFSDLINNKKSFKFLTDKIGKDSPNFLAILKLDLINGGVTSVALIDAFKIKK